MTKFEAIKKFCEKRFGKKCFIAGNTILINSDVYDAVYDISDKFGQFASCWINDPPSGTTDIAWDAVIPFDDYWDMVKAATTPTAPVIVFGSQPFTSAVVMSNPKWFRHHLVWDKNKCGSPGLANYRPMKVHEDVLVFSRKSHKYYPQMEAGKPYSMFKSSKEIQKETLNTHGYRMKPQDIFNTGTRHPKSILKFPRNFSSAQQVHPTQKPTSILKWLIKSYSNEKDVLIDITCGSCSLGAAAYELGRMCICIEREESYFKLGRQWLHSMVMGRKWDANRDRKAIIGM